MVRISGVADGVPPVRAMPRATASALFLEVPVGEKTTGRIDFGCMSRVFVQDKGTEKNAAADVSPSDSAPRGSEIISYLCLKRQKNVTI